MNKAQISIDVIIALISLLVFAAFYMSFVDSFNESTDKAFVLRQEKMITENLQDIIMIGKANNAGNIQTTIKYLIPKIIDPISKKEKSCTITFSGPNITISFDYGYKTPTETISYTKENVIGLSDVIISGNQNCGSILEVSTT